MSPQTSRELATEILPSTPVSPNHSYLLTWDMRVEGEKAWRFRADFAGVVVRFSPVTAFVPTLEKQTSCWQTLDWQSAWLVIEPPQGTQSIDAAMSIEFRLDLPGRFRVRNVRLVDLGDAIPLANDESELHVSVVDEENQPTPARVYILDQNGRGVTPPHTYAYTQGTRCFELIDPRLSRLALPAGSYTVRAMKGFEHLIASQTVEVKAGERRTVTLAMRKSGAAHDSEFWRSTDHHVHLYRHGGSLYPMMDLRDVMEIAKAEGLDYLPFQGVDRAFERSLLADDSISLNYTQEYTRDFWGHFCPIFLWPEINFKAGEHIHFPIKQHGSAAPMNADYIEALRSFGNGAIAYAHPYGPLRRGEEFASLQNPKAGLIAREWPIDVALGAPCTIDMLAKEDARGEFDLKLRDYMRLLDLGFRCGVTGSTDFHLDQGREPIGGLRSYARASASGWKEISEAYNSGATYATNGPLVDFVLGDHTLGKMLKIGKPGKIAYSVDARSLWGLDRAQIWKNGALAEELAAKDGAITKSGSITIERSGWLLVIVEGPAVAEVMSSPEGKPCAWQGNTQSQVQFMSRWQTVRPRAMLKRQNILWVGAMRLNAGLMRCARNSPKTVWPCRTRKSQRFASG